MHFDFSDIFLKTSPQCFAAILSLHFLPYVAEKFFLLKHPSCIGSNKICALIFGFANKKYNEIKIIHLKPFCFGLRSWYSSSFVDTASHLKYKCKH